MKNSSKRAIVLFNQDLRIVDNPAFFSALKNHHEILPLFILDEVNQRKIGSAAKWFLHYALISLSTVLQKKYDLKLITKKGDSLKIISEIFATKNITAIYFNDLIEPDSAGLQEKIRKLVQQNSIEIYSFNSQTIFAPQKIKTGEGNYFKVFTPFWNKALKNIDQVASVLAAPDEKNYESINIKSDDLALLHKKSWAKKFEKEWEFDYEKIKKDFFNFLKNKIHNYAKDRNIPSLKANSKMSPYLHFGMVSPRSLFNLTLKVEPSEGSKQFLNELGWREFCHHLLFHFPQLPNKNFRSEFDNFPWQENHEAFEKWQKGQTGFPIVDAGMRELWATGTMHNRVRMIVASFLIKDLLIDWREGEKYFWETLCDADLANNCANWQWVAGSGADAAPYFRIFNPSLQGKRFDEDGNYVRKWIPELKNLPNKFIHQPWEADSKLLKKCKIELGKTYPQPMLNHEAARNMALMLYKNLKI